VLAGAAAAIAAALSCGGTHDAFSVRLSGPLWADRTIPNDEGRPDIGLVEDDEPLVVDVRGARDLDAVDVLVAGRRVATARPACAARGCPDHVRLTVTPALDTARAGHRAIEVIARGATGRRTAMAFGVEATPVSPVIHEAEPAPARGRAVSALSPDARRRALGVIADARRRVPYVRALLPAVPVRVLEAGRLTDGGRPIGATLLLELARPRRGVGATVPGYLDGTAAPGRPQPVTFVASVLSDLLVDVDLRGAGGRVVAVEPGPRSQIRRWSAAAGPPRRRVEDAPDSLPPPFDQPLAPPLMERLSDRGPAFLNYDGDSDPLLNAQRRDWPVSLVFAGHATIAKVKTALRAAGLIRTGHARYLAYRSSGEALRFDSDRGLKTRCDAAGTDVHVRLYAPAATDRFVDPEFGDVVVATTHLDHLDGCGTGPQLYGFSEAAAARITALLARQGWSADAQTIDLANAEPYRRDLRDPGHIWQSDGRATVIRVP
jgi:hypothetical protein